MNCFNDNALFAALLGGGGCFAMLLLLTFRETVHELRLVFSGRVAGFSAWRGFVAAAGIASVLVGIGALVPGASMVVTTIFMSALVVTLVTALVMSVYWCGEEVIGDPVSGRLDEIRARWDAERSFESPKTASRDASDARTGKLTDSLVKTPPECVQSAGRPCP